MNPILLDVCIWAPVATVVAVAMDLWAGFLHARVWHAWLWSIHKSHHALRPGRFEENDLLALFHAPIAIALILHGCVARPSFGREVEFGVGLGMTLFAVGYILVHDGLVHERLPVRFLFRFAILRRVAKAHRIHHRTWPGGAPYGLFFGPHELRLANRARRQRKAPSSERPPPPNAPPA